MRKVIKKWLEDFMIDPIFNAIMYGLRTIFIISIIILVIYASYKMITTKDIKCYWTTNGIICGGKIGE